MSHAVEYHDFDSKTPEKRILLECALIADEEGDYEGQIGAIRFADTICKNREEAHKWIEEHDRGWYDQLAVKYKEGRSVNWLVKIEYHC